MSGDCRVLLIGMMGSGKSTIGRLLSSTTGWPYLDNDDLVRRAHGATPRDLQVERGTDAMRRAESDALAVGLGEPGPVIVGVAAGVILDDSDRAALARERLVVWLRATAPTLAARAAGSAHRPWLEGDPVEWMAAAVGQREPLYASVADLVLDTESGSPTDAVRKIREWLATTSACEAEPSLTSVART